MHDLKEMKNTMPQTGSVRWVSVRPERRAPVQPLDEVVASETDGLHGDHYDGMGGNRHVTLIQAEHLQTVAAILGIDTLNPGLTRRNIVVGGVNLLAFSEQRFQIGEAILEMTGPCHPCSRMEENLGSGGYNAMRGHGGITARVVKGGKIRVGDTVSLIPGGNGQ
jgi:MOSC domain-containing protein YiiM